MPSESKKCPVCESEFECLTARYGRIYCSIRCRSKARFDKLQDDSKATRGTSLFRAAVADGLCGYCRSKPLLDKTACGECRKVVRDSGRNKRLRAKRLVLTAYGGLCQCCGEARPEFLAVDHINNDGKLDRELVGSSSRFYYWLIRNSFPKNRYQLLCFNCNFAKAAYGECPHIRERRDALCLSKDYNHDRLISVA